MIQSLRNIVKVSILNYNDVHLVSVNHVDSMTACSLQLVCDQKIYSTLLLSSTEALPSIGIWETLSTAHVDMEHGNKGREKWIDKQ